MARNPSTAPENSGRITAPDGNYPYGSAKDDTTGTAKDGTPIVKGHIDDIYGFQQALLNQAAIVPTGNADTIVASQYLDALRTISFLLYANSVDYPIGATVRGSDGIAYRCLIANGPASSVVDPVGDVTDTWTTGLAKQTAAPNLLYGGEGRVAQRGASLPGLGGAGTEYTLDGVQILDAANTARGTITPGGNVPLHPSSVKFEVTTAVASVPAGAKMVSRMPIEAQDLQSLGYGAAGAKTLTLRLLAAFPVTGAVSVSVYNEDANRSYVATITVAVADVFAEYLITIPGDVAGAGINNDSGAGLWFCVALASGAGSSTPAGAWTTGEFYSDTGGQNLVDTIGHITEFVAKLEVGEATPFEPVTFDEAVSRAHRYYQRLGFGLTGGFVSASTITIGATFLKEMRVSNPARGLLTTTPTINETGVGGVQSGVGSINNFGGLVDENGISRFQITGFTGGTTGAIVAVEEEELIEILAEM